MLITGVIVVIGVVTMMLLILWMYDRIQMVVGGHPPRRMWMHIDIVHYCWTTMLMLMKKMVVLLCV